MHKKTMKREVFPGKPVPLGANYYKTTHTNFSIFSRHATRVELLLFNHETDCEPSQIIEFDPLINKTGDIWHIAVKDVNPGDYYGYRIHGPYEPMDGHRFNHHKLLIDPYAKALTGQQYDEIPKARGFNWNSPKKDLSFSSLSSLGCVPKSIVVDDDFDWGDDKHPLIPMNETVIYELHVKGYTHHSSSKVKHPGTFSGLAEKIPYLKSLGVTAVELLPIQSFNQNEYLRVNPKTGQILRNYWGYSTIAFFAPHTCYASDSSSWEQIVEFKKMVKAFHSQGIEIILDVVFNHTAEGNEKGPTLNFRGIDNKIYYMLEDGRYYKNYSGCGNTLNCNHPIVRDYILDSLRYWVTQMKVDGFRFDLASILGRDKNGEVLENPPLIERIAEDPVLRDTKIIAEAWDAAGLYQVGSFPGRWAEWNGKYRDAIRSFWKGDHGQIGELATRLAGSSDLYELSDRSPNHSINFITCHDGFTLNDLVSYNEKHNNDNMEDNRDGENHNLSYNHGFEGLTDDPHINEVRERQRKNFITTLMISQGVPMILAGDEFGRTQNGNNNPWCQDNEISWIDWESEHTEKKLLRFTQKIIELRKNHSAFKRETFFKNPNELNHADIPDIGWYDHRGHLCRWQHHQKSIAFYLSGSKEDTGFLDDDDNFYIMINAHHKKLSFRLPQMFKEYHWGIIVNTGEKSPHDICLENQDIFNTSKRITLHAHSIMILRNSLHS